MISPSAVVDPQAQLAPGVSVGPFSIIHANVRLGAGSVVGSHCILGHQAPTGGQEPLTVGSGSVIRSHSILYEGSSFGPRLETGHRVTIREGVSAGENLRVGTQCDLQGDTVIGDFVRCHSSVHIGKHTQLGSYVWVYPYTVITNDPHPPSDVRLGAVVEDYAVIGTTAVVLPGVRVGRDAVVSAGSVVTRDVGEGDLVAGVPARRVRAASEVRYRGELDIPAYPWRRHFHRGFPAALCASWDSEIGET
jgi:acetyltransferase-like isoleucine patch superfamily enzyme